MTLNDRAGLAVLLTTLTVHGKDSTAQFCHDLISVLQVQLNSSFATSILSKLGSLI